MLENTTVILSLQDFETLRAGEKAHRQIASRLARCFEYSCTKNPYPYGCENCPSAANEYSLPSGKSGMIHNDCTQCAVFKNYNEFNERLTVDVARLIQTAKDYAVYGKDIDPHLDGITIERKAEGAGA